MNNNLILLELIFKAFLHILSALVSVSPRSKTIVQNRDSSDYFTVEKQKHRGKQPGWESEDGAVTWRERKARRRYELNRKRPCV